MEQAGRRAACASMPGGGRGAGQHTKAASSHLKKRTWSNTPSGVYTTPTALQECGRGAAALSMPWLQPSGRGPCPPRQLDPAPAWGVAGGDGGAAHHLQRGRAGLARVSAAQALRGSPCQHWQRTGVPSRSADAFAVSSTLPPPALRTSNEAHNSGRGVGGHAAGIAQAPTQVPSMSG